MGKFIITLIGIIFALLCCGILIYAIETERSFLQIILAFLILIIPFSFLSVITGKISVFIFTSILIIGGFVCYKHHWYDVSFGVVLSLLVGGAVHVFKTSKAKLFSSTDYKIKQRKC